MSPFFGETQDQGCLANCDPGATNRCLPAAGSATGGYARWESLGDGPPQASCPASNGMLPALPRSSCWGGLRASTAECPRCSSLRTAGLPERGRSSNERKPSWLNRFNSRRAVSAVTEPRAAAAWGVERPPARCFSRRARWIWKAGALRLETHSGGSLVRLDLGHPDVQRL